jgi:hypothetical protein
MRRISRAYFDAAKETVAILPRGNFKTTLAALLGLHHLLSVRGASVVIGASSRDQARICFERMQSFLAHPALEGAVTQRHLELRFDGPEGRRLLRVVPSDGPRTHGHSCSALPERAGLRRSPYHGGAQRRSDGALDASPRSGDGGSRCYSAETAGAMSGGDIIFDTWQIGVDSCDISICDRVATRGRARDRTAPEDHAAVPRARRLGRGDGGCPDAVRWSDLQCHARPGGGMRRCRVARSAQRLVRGQGAEDRLSPALPPPRQRRGG